MTAVEGAPSGDALEGLRAGSLVEVLADVAPPPVPIHAVFPSARLMSGKVRAFLDMAEQAAARWQFLDHA